MGVLKSRKFILAKETIDVSQLKNKRVAIDMMIYIIGFYFSTTSNFFWHSKILNFINFLVENKIDVTCVYDGNNKHKKKYIRQRNKKFPSYEEVSELNDLILNKFKNKVKILISDGEAESCCAFLLKEKKVDFIISDDSDLILYDTNFIHISCKYNKIIKKYDYELNLYQVKNNLQNDKLHLFCLLLGTDYTKRNSPGNVLDLLEKDLDTIIEYFNKINDNKYEYYMSNHFLPNGNFKLYKQQKNINYNIPLLKVH